MIHVVTGGSGSGKSAYAEAVISNGRQGERLYYIATMKPYGKETKAKIDRHRKMRAGKGFETIECYTDLLAAADSLEKDCCVLLECMSNLVANEMYEAEGAGSKVVTEIIAGVHKLHAECADVVIVTNEVFSEAESDTQEMQRYKKMLGEINVALARMADKVTEVVYGIPIRVKGDD